jgi:3-(3-hydroxy-phenyl)propionate hydroxylase
MTTTNHMTAPKAEFTSSGGGYELPVYPFQPPPELQGARAQRYPIVIVGGGLAGLTLACDLGVRGVPVVLLDEDNTVGVRGASSRGICYAQRSLETFKRLGIYERIAAKGIQWSVGRTLAGNDEVYNFDLRKNAAQSVSEQPPFINIQQFYVEWFLAERILQLPSVDLRWKSRVMQCTQTADAVQLEIETPAGNYTLACDWLVDATGVHSAIRKGFGLNVNAAKGDDRWCISDVRFKHHPPIERWTWIEAPFNDNRAVWQHLMADDVWRLDYQMDPACDMDYVSRADVVQERLQKQFGPQVEFELVWVGPYSYRSHCLDNFQHGHVLFAGDCAHVMSPFGARGGNSAIADADNLGWKLAMVTQGKMPARCLHSYDQERREGARQNIEFTRRTSRYLSPENAAEKLFRDATIALARHYPFARGLVNTGRMSSANVYPESALNLGAGAGKHIQNVALHFNGQATDLIALQAAHQHNILLLLFGRCGEQSAAFAKALARLPVSVVRVGTGIEDIQDTQAKLATQFPGLTDAVAVLRPDLYCAGTANAHAAEALVHQLKEWFA